MMVRILGVLTGKVKPFRGPDEPSAIAKRLVEGPVAVEMLGLVGDQQADRSVHGGLDKAVHHYPADHYAFWRGEFDGHPLLTAAGAFGENISALGLVEADVCIGDRFRLGSALVEVSQGRQPCWKLGHRFGSAAVAAQVVATRRSGWYYRVIEPGLVQAGDPLSLVGRGQGEWSVEQVFGLLIGVDGKRDLGALRALQGHSVLSEAWRRRAGQLLGEG